MTNLTAGYCECGGSGVIVTERDYGSWGYRYEIQRCDVCGRFEGDDEAALWTQSLLGTAAVREDGDAPFSQGAP